MNELMHQCTRLEILMEKCTWLLLLIDVWETCYRKLEPSRTVTSVTGEPLYLQGCKYKPANLKMPIDKVTTTGILNYKSETDTI